MKTILISAAIILSGICLSSCKTKDSAPTDIRNAKVISDLVNGETIQQKQEDSTVIADSATEAAISDDEVIAE